MRVKPIIQSQLVMPQEAFLPYITAFLLTSINAVKEPQTVDLFPVGHAVLSFALDDHSVVLDGINPVNSKWNLTGQLTRHHTISVGGAYSYLYVLFKPTGAFRFFGDTGSIEDSFADVCSLVEDDPVTQKTYADLQSAGKKSKQALRIMEKWLQDRLEKPFDVHVWELATAACDMIEESNGSMPVTEVCEALYVSKTKLERTFLRAVGTSPKRYSRIVRFNHAYQLITSGAYKDWQEIVVRYAYFDQAHFIKEFRVFCGYTPAQLHQSVVNIAAHVVEKRS